MLVGMAPRIPKKTRQLIIGFPDQPKRGEVSRFCRDHKISRSVFYEIRARARDQGAEAAITARSTAPKHQALQVDKAVEERALATRADLDRNGLYAGPLSVADRMRRDGLAPPSRATLARVFTRNGMVVPEPSKRPRASYKRFVYPDPNGCWQLDGFEFELDNGQTRCVLQVEDDHSRYVLASLVALSENSDAVIEVVSRAIIQHGVPARFLTDNGVALNRSRLGVTTRLEAYLRSLGVEPITGRPNKPTTQGKNERLHQTIRKYLNAHRPITTGRQLQRLVDEFDDYYNHHRSHQGLEPGQAPADAYQAKPKAKPRPVQPPDSIGPSVRAIPPQSAPQPSTETGTPPPARRRKMKGEQPISNDEDAPRWAERRVSTTGRICICNNLIYLGEHLVGHTMRVLFDDQTITVFNPDGTQLGSVAKGPRRTRHTRKDLQAAQLQPEPSGK